MAEEGCTPDHDTFTELVAVFLESRDLDSALQACDQMKHQVTLPNSRVACSVIRALPFILGHSAHAQGVQIMPHLPQLHKAPVASELDWVAAYCRNHPSTLPQDNTLLTRYALVSAGTPHLIQPTNQRLRPGPYQSRRLQHLLAVRCAWDGFEPAILELKQLQATAQIELGEPGVRAVLTADVLGDNVPPVCAGAVRQVYGVLESSSRSSSVVPRMLLGYMRNTKTSMDALVEVESQLLTHQVELDAPLTRELIVSWMSAQDRGRALTAYKRGLKDGLFQGASVLAHGQLWHLDLHGLPYAVAQIALAHTVNKLSTLGKVAPEWLAIGVGRGLHGRHAGHPEMKRRVLCWLRDFELSPVRPTAKVAFPKAVANRFKPGQNQGMVLVRHPSKPATRKASTGHTTDVTNCV